MSGGNTPLRDFLVIVAVDVPAYATVVVPATSFVDALAKVEVIASQVEDGEFEADPSEFKKRLRLSSICDTSNHLVNVDHAISGTLLKNQRSAAEEDAYRVISNLLDKCKSTSLNRLDPADLQSLAALRDQLECLQVAGGPNGGQPWDSLLAVANVS